MKVHPENEVAVAARMNNQRDSWRPAMKKSVTVCTSLALRMPAHTQ